MKVPFNKPVYLQEHSHCFDGLDRAEKLSGDGPIIRRCEAELTKTLQSPSLLVTSGTAALEMMALLLDIGPGDEVILPSYTFVSTASAFCLRGATIRYADIDSVGNISLTSVEELINKKTKAVCAVHYGGHSCDLDVLQQICDLGKVHLLEDGAQGVNAFYKGRPLGAIGALGCLSFHDTKNITSGEGGALILGDKSFLERAEILRDKGTNRRSFLRGQVDRYSWVDLGSSYCLSELNAAYLEPQFKLVDQITKRRGEIWNLYERELSTALESQGCEVLRPPAFNQPNFHMFAFLTRDPNDRTEMIRRLNQEGVGATSHYEPLHLSKFGSVFTTDPLPETESFAPRIVRLPLWYNMQDQQVDYVIDTCKEILQSSSN